VISKEAKMCPLRVILLFLSAMLAGYFAFKSVRSEGDSSILDLSEDEADQAIEETGFLTKVCGIGLLLDRLRGVWKL